MSVKRWNGASSRCGSGRSAARGGIRIGNPWKPCSPSRNIGPSRSSGRRQTPRESCRDAFHRLGAQIARPSGQPRDVARRVDRDLANAEFAQERKTLQVCHAEGSAYQDVAEALVDEHHLNELDLRFQSLDEPGPLATGYVKV